MTKLCNTFLKSTLAGICIGLGGTIFLLVKDSFSGGKVVGALLFTVGLFTICTRGYDLFTGKACYLPGQDPNYIGYLLTVWLGNFTGCAFVASGQSYTSIFDGLSLTARQIVESKMDSGLLSLFFLGFFCNIFIYIAVDGYKNNPHELGKYLGLFLGVAGFILAGTEHCVADMYYWCVSGMIFERPVRSLACLIVISLGNVLGGIFFPLIERESTK